LITLIEFLAFYLISLLSLLWIENLYLISWFLVNYAAFTHCLGITLPILLLLFSLLLLQNMSFLTTYYILLKLHSFLLLTVISWWNLPSNILMASLESCLPLVFLLVIPYYFLFSSISYTLLYTSWHLLSFLATNNSLSLTLSSSTFLQVQLPAHYDATRYDATV